MLNLQKIESKNCPAWKSIAKSIRWNVLSKLPFEQIRKQLNMEFPGTFEIESIAFKHEMQ